VVRHLGQIPYELQTAPTETEDMPTETETIPTQNTNQERNGVSKFSHTSIFFYVR